MKEIQRAVEMAIFQVTSPNQHSQSFRGRPRMCVEAFRTRKAINPTLSFCHCSDARVLLKSCRVQWDRHVVPSFEFVDMTNQ